MALTKAKILAAKDFKLSAALPVPEWGGEVFIRTISGAERDRFEEAYSEHKMKAFRVRFLVLTLCDEAGERIFSDDEHEALSQKSSTVINRLFDKAWEHNAFTEASVEALGNDSPIDQNASSTST